MSKDEFLKQQYLTLRDEIRSSKSRAFFLTVLGTLLIPVIAYGAQASDLTFATASMPFIILVIMLAFLMEQNSIVRAGRYLKEHVEPHIDGVMTWETWLESNHRLREMDKYFFGSSCLIFFLFYAIGSIAAVMSWAQSEWPEQYFYAAIAYGIGGFWFVVVFFRQWHSRTTTC